MASGSTIESTEASSAQGAAAKAAEEQHGGVFNWAARTFSSLENRNFRLLWFGMLLSMGGFQMQMIARGILVYDITDSQSLPGAFTLFSF